MLRVSLFLSFLALSSAFDFKYSVVITSADIPVDQPQQLSNLQVGNAYRIYATFASGGSEDYAKNVLIYDSTGATYTVNSLSQPKPDSGYILDNIRILRAPIYIHDSNKGAASRVPFTVYVVDSSVTTFPVVSARHASGEVDSNNGFLAAGLTVLSAEPYFTMYNFDIGSISSMVISSVGYDESNSAYQVMYLNSPNEARLSFLSVYGPIATLFNANYGLNARFKFQYTKNQKYDFQLSPGASFALMSPGYLSSGQSYNIPYPMNGDALDRSYTFATNNILQVNYIVNNFQANDNILLRFITAENEATDFNLKSDDNRGQVQWANRISMTAQNANADHAPRFLFKVTSGSSLSFSLLGVLLVALFSKFY